MKLKTNLQLKIIHSQTYKYKSSILLKTVKYATNLEYALTVAVAESDGERIIVGVRRAAVHDDRSDGRLGERRRRILVRRARQRLTVHHATQLGPLK